LLLGWLGSFYLYPNKGGHLMASFQQPYVICDIDGVLADCTHRLHFILKNCEEKDWESFDRLTPYDTPIRPTIHLIRLLYAEGRRIILMTGRGERVRAATETWLQYHDIPYHELIMRSEGDRRPAWVVKMQKINRENFGPHNTFCIFEDEPETVSKMREAGFLVYDPLEWRAGWEQVNEGGKDHTKGEQ
jgi:hypothetical protein